MSNIINFPDPKRQAQKRFDDLFDFLNRAEDTRRELEAAGFEMPLEVREAVARMRRQLADAGLPQELIDATPGLGLAK
jgi:hypothetical protein